MAIISTLNGYNIYCDNCNKLLNSSVVLVAHETLNELEESPVLCKECKRGKDYVKLCVEGTPDR